MSESTPDLIRRLFAGNQSAFGQLDQVFRAQVERFIRTRVSQTLPDAEDVIKEITQETMLEASKNPFSRGRRFDPSKPFIPWLFGVAKNCANRHFDRRPPEIHSQRVESRISPETVDNDSNRSSFMTSENIGL